MLWRLVEEETSHLKTWNEVAWGIQQFRESCRLEKVLLDLHQTNQDLVKFYALSMSDQNIGSCFVTRHLHQQSKLFGGSKKASAGVNDILTLNQIIFTLKDVL